MLSAHSQLLVTRQANSTGTFVNNDTTSNETNNWVGPSLCFEMKEANYILLVKWDGNNGWLHQLKYFASILATWPCCGGNQCRDPHCVRSKAPHITKMGELFEMKHPLKSWLKSVIVRLLKWRFAYLYMYSVVQAYKLHVHVHVSITTSWHSMPRPQQMPPCFFWLTGLCSMSLHMWLVRRASGLRFTSWVSVVYALYQNPFDQTLMYNKNGHEIVQRVC